MPRVYPSNSVFDSLGELSGGVNSGLNPLLLQNNELSFGSNLTLRGAFARPRPPWVKRALSFGGDAALSLRVRKGLFQGAHFYRPDSGASSLRSAIAGNLYNFEIADDGLTVTDITRGNSQSPTTTQHWLWQAEMWTIWNDGLNLPVFADQSTTRRSRGPSRLLATTTGPFVVPDVGATVTVTLTAPWTLGFDFPVILNEFFYQPVGNASGYPADLTTLFTPTGGAAVDGEEVVIVPARVGYVTAGGGVAGGVFAPGAFVIGVTLSAPYTGPVGQYVLINGQEMGVLSKSGNNLTLNNRVAVPAGFSVAPGDLVEIPGSIDPNVVIGAITSGPFPIPAAGATATATLTQPFVGTPGQVVWIGDHQFTIVAGPDPAASTSLTLINLNDVSADPIAAEPILSIPELPAGRMGAYGLGRNVMSLVDGISYIIGDIVGGDTGTQAYSFRDSVLTTIENDFLEGGGTFRIPSSGQQIKAICFSSQINTALGQGPCQIYTDESVFTVNVPVDRAAWALVTNPLQTQALIGTGAQGQDSTFQVNSDTFFRSFDSWNSLVDAVRDFQSQWGNTPLGREMERTFDKDDETLLPYGSGVKHDNRALFTADPQTSNQGVFHKGLVALNFDPVSTISTKNPPIYDGLWTGPNVLRILTGVSGGRKRCFAFVYNVTLEEIEVWELLLGKSDIKFDNGNIPITWSFETSALFKNINPPSPTNSHRQLLQLWDGEMRVADVIGTLNYTIEYKPDQWPCWIPWITDSICATPPTAAAPNLKPGFFPRVGWGEPPLTIPGQDGEVIKLCDDFTDRPFRDGYNYQIKITFTGYATFLGLSLAAIPAEEPTCSKPPCNNDA